MALYSVLTWDVTVWKICIIASLTASVNAAMNASVKRALLIHGFSSVLESFVKVERSTRVVISSSCIESSTFPYSGM